MSEQQSARVTVDGPRPYEVALGRGIFATVLDHVPQRASRVAILHAPFLSEQAGALAQSAQERGLETLQLTLPDAEAAKTAGTLNDCWEALGKAHFTRADVIIGIGGGATTDLAGFVAATWLRGVDIIQVPTTLLAMVDAAVGGKTGINTYVGKNLVGAIHPPIAVICDLDFLDTLSTADYSAGLAEVIKAGFIRDPRILEIVETDFDEVLDPTSDAAREVILRAIQVKADVVGDDLTESIDRELGREVLNYGHTLGHAIERSEGYQWRHGECVSIGMVFAAELARLDGRLTEEDVARHRNILESVGLPTSYPDGEFEALLETMAVDKKARGNTIRFIVLNRIGEPGILAGPDTALLEKGFAALQ